MHAKLASFKGQRSRPRGRSQWVLVKIWCSRVSNQLSTKFCTYEHNSAYDLHRSAILVSNCSPGFPQQYGACLVPISHSERKPEPPVSELFQTVYRPTTPIIDRPLPGCILIIDHLGFSPTAHYAVNSALFTIILHCVYIMHSQTCTVNSI